MQFQTLILVREFNVISLSTSEHPHFELEQAARQMDRTAAETGAYAFTEDWVTYDHIEVQMRYWRRYELAATVAAGDAEPAAEAAD